MAFCQLFAPLVSMEDDHCGNVPTCSGNSSPTQDVFSSSSFAIKMIFEPAVCVGRGALIVDVEESSAR